MTDMPAAKSQLRGVDVGDDLVRKIVAFLRAELGVEASRHVFAELLTAYREVELLRLKASTQVKRVQDLRILERFCGTRPLSEAREVGREFLAAYADRPGRCTQLWAVFARIVRVACELGWLERFPLTGLRPPAAKHRERVLSLDELQRLRAALVQGGNVAARALLFMTVVPLRIGEVVALDWSWVDLDASRLRMPGRKSRGLVVFLPEQAPALMGEPGSGPVFGASMESIRNAWDKACRRAGITGATPHTLRHSWTTHALEQGAPLEWVRLQLGHSKNYMTARYSHCSQPEQLPLMLTQIESVLSGGKAR